MEKIICDNCLKDIGDYDETCPHCGAVTDFKSEENQPNNFREHAKKSAYPGRNYEAAKKVSLFRRILRRLGNR